MFVVWASFFLEKIGSEIHLRVCYSRVSYGNPTTAQKHFANGRAWSNEPFWEIVFYVQHMRM